MDKTFSTFSFYTLVSRVLGYLRDILIAFFLGASIYADAFFVAFRLPNTFRRLFAEGVSNAAFIPSYTKASLNNVADGKKFADDVLNLLIIVLLGIVLRLIDCIRLFDIIYITTRGGPGISTEVMAFFTYRTEFRSFQIGSGSASAVIILIISLIVTTIAVTLLRRVEKNEGLS